MINNLETHSCDENMPVKHQNSQQAELEQLKNRQQNCYYGLMSMVIGVFGVQFILIVESLKIYKKSKGFNPLNAMHGDWLTYRAWWVLAGLVLIGMVPLLLCAKAVDSADKALRKHNSKAKHD